MGRHHRIVVEDYFLDIFNQNIFSSYRGIIVVVNVGSQWAEVDFVVLNIKSNCMLKNL